MITDLVKYFENKRVIILGFGREGQSTYNFIRKYLKEQVIYIADEKVNFEENNEILKNDKNVVCISGKDYLDNLEHYDIIMKSPGISFVNIDTKNFIHKIKSQLELFLEYTDAFTIGVTGTKGKSTTSSLIYKVIKDQNINTMLLGNIGEPVFNHIDNMKQDLNVVLEMSSHQLEYMRKSPNIAILLNAYEEHLDHYKSYDEYVEAKCNIFRYQDESDYLLYNSDNKVLNNFIRKTIGNTYKVSIAGDENSDIYLKNENILLGKEAIYNVDEPRNLMGEYNLNNIMFVLGVSKILKLDMDKVKKSIASFKTLKHRLELVGTYEGVSYYDNSIGTVPMATIEAVKALDNVDTLIIGGMDRGIDYTEFIEFLNSSNISNVICMPKTGHDIAKKLKKEKRIIVDDLKEAVDISKTVTKKDKSCLLSPAAASYGFFKNFEEKGDLFAKLVKSVDK